MKADRHRIDVIDEAIATLYRETETARQKGWLHRERLMNVSLFVLVLERDFAEYRLEMVSSLEPWRLRLTARNVAILLYEASTDLLQMFGKEFRESLQFLEVPDATLTELNLLTKGLNKWKKEHDEFLGNEIRNVCGGHREQDAVKLLDSIRAIDPIRVFRIGTEFYKIVNPLVNCLTNITLHSGRLNIILKQLTKG